MRSSRYLDSIYVPLVSPARGFARRELHATFAAISAPEQLLGWLLSSASLRMAELREVPGYLRLAADNLPASVDPAIGRALCRLAKVEEQHRRLLLEDLVELQQAFEGLALRDLLRAPIDDRVVRHERLRRLIPARELPLLNFAVELELAELDMLLVPLLLDARARLGVDRGRRFYLARGELAAKRSAAASMILAEALTGPELARSWAKIGASTTRSALRSLDVCAEQGRELAPYVRERRRWA